MRFVPVVVAAAVAAAVVVVVVACLACERLSDGSEYSCGNAGDGLRDKEGK